MRPPFLAIARCTAGSIAAKPLFAFIFSITLHLLPAYRMDMKDKYTLSIW